MICTEKLTGKLPV